MPAPEWAHRLLDVAWEPHHGKTRIQVGDIDPTAIAVAAWGDNDRNTAPRFRVNFENGQPNEWLVAVPWPQTDPAVTNMTLDEYLDLKEDA